MLHEGQCAPRGNSLKAEALALAPRQLVQSRSHFMVKSPARTAARQASTAGRVDWVTGAVLAARRSAIEQVGRMDERYFLYWEDLDWCYRMQRAGWGVYAVPEARAIHTCRREGVCRPLSRAGREQLLGAFKFFRKFGWNPGKAA